MKSYDFNILVFRTVRVTDFGFIIKKIKSKYLNSKITIFTKQQNEDLIKLIDGVNESITYENEPIIYNTFNQKDINYIKEKKFNLIIIPHNGFIDAYDNVLNFAKKIFKDSKIIFFQLPENFYEYKYDLKKNIYKKIIAFISMMLTPPFFIIYMFFLIINSLHLKFLKNINKNNSL